MKTSDGEIGARKRENLALVRAGDDGEPKGHRRPPEVWHKSGRQPSEFDAPMGEVSRVEWRMTNGE